MPCVVAASCELYRSVIRPTKHVNRKHLGGIMAPFSNLFVALTGLI